RLMAQAPACGFGAILGRIRPAPRGLLRARRSCAAQPQPPRSGFRQCIGGLCRATPCVRCALHAVLRLLYPRACGLRPLPGKTTMLDVLGQVAFGLFGLAVLVTIAVLFSSNRRAISWKLV